AAQATAVSSTLAGAVETAQSMTGAPPAWLETAKSGFSLGFAASCVLATAMLLLLAFFSRRVYAAAHINKDSLTSH
ncbi:MAG TPA: MFS transporter, partial [Pseudorhizobium sp.]|nr:MFS transporter [Pseudorhizobium sp.]